MLSRVFDIEAFAEYTLSEDEDKDVLVFQIGDGGLGGELHMYQSDETLDLPDYGIGEQVEFATDDKGQFELAKEELDEIGIPYQTLDQDNTKSLRINEASGISFILTLEYN